MPLVKHSVRAVSYWKNRVIIHKVKTYIALFRGINVTGYKIVKMDELRKCFESAGFKNVQTYIQSGNVVFESTDPTPKITTKIQKIFEKSFKFTAPVTLVEPTRLKKIIQKNEFSKNTKCDPKRIHVTFLDQKPAKEGLAKLATFKSGKDEWKNFEDVIYLHCPDGYGKSKLSNNQIERILGVGATTRNWNTVQELYRMAYSG